MCYSYGKCGPGRAGKRLKTERSKLWLRQGRKERSLALYETILKLKDLDECCKFFDDLCTPTELRSLEQRFDVAVYLQQGLVYLDILEKTAPAAPPSAGCAGPCWTMAPEA